MTKLFRFLNLLEPGKNIISISKVFLWSTIFVLLWTTINTPEQTLAVLGAMFANFVSIANYAYRRHIQFMAGNTDACAGVPRK